MCTNEAELNVPGRLESTSEKSMFFHVRFAGINHFCSNDVKRLIQGHQVS